jgi:hypothetical protein
MPNALVSLAATLPPGATHGWIGNWSPGIGDPTFVGWFTVVAYFLAALACWRVRAGSPETQPRLRRKEHVFWTGLTVAMLFLCLNKQLDLQTAFTEVLRGLAKRQGWYDARFAYQKAFIASMAGASLVAVLLCVRLTLDLPGSVKTAGVGMVLIAFFVLIRAASFHHIDRLLGQTILLLHVNWLVELGGIAVVLLGATRRGHDLRASRMRKIGSSEIGA